MTVSPSRRRLLQAALLSPTLAACMSRADDRPAPIDPDVAIRAAAIARERALVEQYLAVTASSSAVVAQTAGLLAEHEQHLAALDAATPSPSATARQSPVATLAQLAAAEHAAAGAHAADALRASRPLAAVLASLAASEASHAVVLA